MYVILCSSDELDELTARRHPKSPRSLSGRSLQPTLVTNRSLWRHQMETFATICVGNSPVKLPLYKYHRRPSTVNSPHKGQWRGALMLSLICAWINDWVNNGEAGDLIRHRAHYDVTIMLWSWNTDRHAFCSMSISPPVPKIRLFQSWPWKCNVKVMAKVEPDGPNWG